jgi:cytochrome c biogenesis protein
MLSKLNKFFSSIKLAIILFILIAAVSIIGTVIDQGDTIAQYKIIYGNTVFHILYWLGFLNIYDSWYFVGLAALLILTMIISSANKLPKIIKNIVDPNTSFDYALKKNSYKAKYITLQSSKSPYEILNFAEKTFGKKFGKPVLKISGKDNNYINDGKNEKAQKTSSNADNKENNSGNFLFFSKNSIFRISPIIAHLGAIVILAGVLLGVALGYRSYTNIKVGQTVQHSYLLKNNHPVLLPFKIKLDNYVTKYYKNGMPKAYISTLTIIKKHITILTKSIRVNHPLTYDGITIYQASYGHYKPNAAQILVLNLNLKNSNKNNKRLVYAVPGKIYNSKINNIKFSFNFFKHPAKDQIPFYISVIKNDKTVGSPLVFQELPYRTKKGNMPLFFAKYNNNIAFIFAGIKTYYYSGVEITKNVDTDIVWIGSAILIFALFFSFFFNQQSLWVRVTPSENEKTNKIEILSVPHKKFASFYSMMDRLMEIFKKQI